MSGFSSPQPRLTTSPTTPALAKLPKFLHKTPRDRSRSLNEPAAGPVASTSTPTELAPPKTHNGRSIVKKTSRLFSGGGKDKDVGDKLTPPEPAHQASNAPSAANGGPAIRHREREDSISEPPVIIEPPSNPRPRPRTGAMSSDPNHPSTTLNTSPRLSDLPSRLSGWFSHTFTGSTTDLSSLLAQSTLSAQAAGGASPRTKTIGLLTAARHGKGHLDKAMRYLLDSDATPDKCTDPIWLLGVMHPGYEPPPPPASPPPQSQPLHHPFRKGRRDSTDSRHSPPSVRNSLSSISTHHTNSSFSSLSSSSSATATAANSKVANPWPTSFYSDFTSRIWLTYRNQFAPIRDISLATLEPPSPFVSSSAVSLPSDAMASSPSKSRWNWPGAGEKGWTSDSGWGCMLRTGQSLLANSLIHLHLGRDWRKPAHPTTSHDYVTYVRIISWFLDSPSPLAPFGVHRMALAGRALGKEVGQWFGPSTAAGAIKALVHAYPEAQLSVSVASDGVVFESDVYVASNLHGPPPSLVSNQRSERGSSRRRWGGKAVLILVGIRLGLDNVNPIYYETIKALFTFPQSVGIAGGRPSSSYYFVGSQADSLFYLDPHHARPAVPLRPPPNPSAEVVGSIEDSSGTDDSHGQSRGRWEKQTTSDGSDREFHDRRDHRRTPTSPGSSTRSGSSSAFSHHAPLSPSPLSRSSASPPPASDAVTHHYVTAYQPSELRTFHCDRVRKMPLSGLDPSMLLGFLCKNEADWKDFVSRVSKLPKGIFAVQDEPPTWGDDSDGMDVESLSEPDGDHPSASGSESFDTSDADRSRTSRSEIETEDDELLTPMPVHAPTLPRRVTDDDEDWTAVRDEPQPFPVRPGSPDRPPSPTGLPIPVSRFRERHPSLPPRSPSPRLISPAHPHHQSFALRPDTPPPQTPSPPVLQQEHFPFPVSPEPDVTDVEAKVIERMNGPVGKGKDREKKTPQVRSMRAARHGGRTTSGGVKAIWRDNPEGDDF